MLLAGLYYAVDSADARYKWSLSTARVSLLLLDGTLLTGPLNVLRRQRNPVSTDLRRDIGIWSGLVGLAHEAVGWQVHRGNMLLYYFEEDKFTKALALRVELFGICQLCGAGQRAYPGDTADFVQRPFPTQAQGAALEVLATVELPVLRAGGRAWDILPSYREPPALSDAAGYSRLAGANYPVHRFHSLLK